MLDRLIGNALLKGLPNKRCAEGERVTVSLPGLFLSLYDQSGYYVRFMLASSTFKSFFLSSNRCTLLQALIINY